MIPLNGIAWNKFIPEMSALISIKSTKSFDAIGHAVRSSEKWHFYLQSRQMSFKHTTLRYQSTKVAPLWGLIISRTAWLMIVTDSIR